MATPISRRALLRATGTSGLALVLAACSGSSEPTDPATSSEDAGGAPLADSDQIAREAIATVGLDAEPTLTPIVATFEVLTGPTGRVPFGVLDAQQQPLLDRDVQAWVVAGDEVLAGPVTPLYFGEGLGARGVYVADIQLEQTGLFDLVVQVDGDAVGTAPLSVKAPENSTSHPPGATFPVVATPTEEDPGKLEELCTQDPPCGMHEVSLDTVLGERPVVFTVSTPKFCQTAVCGPVVSVIEGVREELGRDDLVFIHAEVYNDAGVTPTDVVNELTLPSEPWTWVIDADGTVVDRFDGPVVPSLLTDAIART